MEKPAGRTVIQVSVSETAVAWHRTELVMDVEPVEYGGPNREMHPPQMASDGDERTEVISMQDLDHLRGLAWVGDSLRMAS